MKKPTSEIYHLVHQMSKSEKRYWSLFAKRHEIGAGNNYFELFQLINEEGIDSDTALKQFFSKSEKSYSFANYLPVAKQQLMGNLLKALCQFQESNSIDEKIKNLCFQAKILFEKGARKLSLAKLKKAQKLAYHYERFHLLLEAHEIKRMIISQQNFDGSSMKDLNALNKESNDCLKLIQDKNDYWFLYSRIYKLHYQKSGNRKQKDEKEILELLNGQLLKEENISLSTSSQLDYLQLNALKYFIQDNPEKAFEFNKRFLEIFDEQEQFLETQAIRYRSTLNNFLVDCVQLQYEKELKEGLKKLRALPKHKAFKNLKDTELQVFRLSNQLEFNWNIYKGNFKENHLLIDGISSKLKRYEKTMSQQSLIVFYYLIAYSCFAIGQFDDCLIWTNKIIVDQDESMLEGLHAAARNLNLITHFELGNLELLGYASENLKRYFKRRNRFFEIEKILIQGINKLINSPKPEHSSIYKKMYDAFGEIKKDPSFDYQYWVLSKLEGKTYEEVFQEKMKK